jgi:hypothetical protein
MIFHKAWLKVFRIDESTYDAFYGFFRNPIKPRYKRYIPIYIISRMEYADLQVGEGRRSPCYPDPLHTHA